MVGDVAELSFSDPTSWIFSLMLTLGAPELNGVQTFSNVSDSGELGDRRLGETGLRAPDLCSAWTSVVLMVFN